MITLDNFQDISKFLGETIWRVDAIGKVTELKFTTLTIQKPTPKDAIRVYIGGIELKSEDAFYFTKEEAVNESYKREEIIFPTPNKYKKYLNFEFQKEYTLTYTNDWAGIPHDKIR